MFLSVFVLLGEKLSWSRNILTNDSRPPNLFPKQHWHHNDHTNRPPLMPPSTRNTVSNSEPHESIFTLACKIVHNKQPQIFLPEESLILVPASVEFPCARGWDILDSVNPNERWDGVGDGLVVQSVGLIIHLEHIALIQLRNQNQRNILCLLLLLLLLLPTQPQNSKKPPIFLQFLSKKQIFNTF